MYELDVIKKTALAKQLGGPPVFHEGRLHAVHIDKDHMALDIMLLSQNNPLLNDDARVTLRLNNLQAFTLKTRRMVNSVFIIHDLDIRKEGEVLRLILESTQGDMNEIVFESIELVER